MRLLNNLPVFLKEKMTKYILLFIAIFTSGISFSQSCASNSFNSWEWPGHSNWFIGNFGNASNITGTLINFQSGFTMTTAGSAIVDQETPVYEGVTAASNDQGELVMFSNGRWAWDGNSIRTSTDIKQGNEGHPSNIVGSASQGILAVRHPLVPNKYYTVTTGDVIGGYAPAVSYNVFDENGLELQGNTTMLGNVFSAEGIAATLHANGVDIWVTVQEAQSPNIHSWLLTCDGFIDSPVVTSIANSLSGDYARGGLAFSHDGSKLATVFGASGTVFGSMDRLIIYDC